MRYFKTFLVGSLLSLLPAVFHWRRDGNFLFLGQAAQALARHNGFRLSVVSGFLVALTGSLVAQTPVWVEAQEEDGVAYLLRKSPSQIMRYDLDAEEWLAPVSLSDIPNAFQIDDGHFFIASSRKLERIDLDGSNKVHIGNTPEDIVGLVTDGNVLFANRSSGSYARFTSFNKTTFSQIAEFEKYVDTVRGASIAPSLNKIFGTRMSGSPRDITFITYNDNGTFIQGGGSPYHGRYSVGAKTWVFPDESKVVDSSGTVYNTVDLSYNNSFGLVLTDLAFHGVDVPVALKDQELISYSNTLRETARYTLSRAAQSLIVHGDKVFAFQEDNASPTKVTVEIVPLSSLEAKEPGEPISPGGLAYSIDDSAVGADGILYLLSKSFSSIFRWDVENQEYLETISLPEASDRIVYSIDLDRLYIYAPSRKVYRIDLDDASLSVVHHTTAPVSVNTLIPLGPDLMVLQNGSWDSQWVYGSGGELLKAHVSCCYDRYHFYDDGTGRLYYDGYWKVYLGEGEFGPREGTGSRSLQPIALSHDGQYMVDLQGQIYNASGPSQIDVLSNSVTNATWNRANTLFTFKTGLSSESTTTIQMWNEYFAIEAERRIPGNAVRLYSHGETVVAITQVDGIPVFTPFDSALRLIPPATLDVPQLALSAFSATAATLTWERVTGAENYVLEKKLSTVEEWTTVFTGSFTDARFTDITLTSGFIYEYRIKAANGDLESDYSEVVEVNLVGVVDDRIDPRTVGFVPDDVRLSADGIVYLLSSEHKSIFAWDIDLQEWAPTIPLTGPAIRFTYSVANDALYTLHPDGSIYSIGLAAANPFEIYFAEIPTITRAGLVAAEEFIIAGRGFSFDASGNLVDQRSLSYAFNDGVWNSVRRNIYHLRDGVSPNDLILTNILEDGTFGVQKDSPFHTSSISWTHPVRSDPAGNIVIIGSGRIFDAGTLEQVGALNGSIQDAVWIDGALITLANSVIYSHSQATYGGTAEVNLNQAGLRLLATDEGRLVSISRTSSGETVVDVYNEDFEIIPPTVLAQPTRLIAAIEAVNRVVLSWTNVAGENGYRIERRSGGFGPWETLGTTNWSITTFQDNDVTTEISYEYRVSAFNGDLESEPSDVLELTVAPPEAPLDFHATALDGFQIRLEWEGVNLASGYRLDRRLSGASSWSVLQEVSPDNTSYTDTGLTPDTLYEYRLRAFNALGSSDWVFDSAITDQVPPDSPSLHSPQATPVSVTVSWSWANYAVEIVIERMLAGSEQWEELAIVLASSGSYIDTDIEPSTAYSYRAKSRNSAGDSSYSMVRSVTTPALPPPSSPLFAIPYPESATSLLITWQKALYAEGYTLDYRAFGSDAWIPLGEFSPGVTDFRHTGLNPSQTYEYRLAAWNEVGASPYATRFGTPQELAALLWDDFEPRENYRMWYRINGGTALNGGQGFDTGMALWFGNGLSVAETMAVDVREGGYLHFSLRAGNSEEDGDVYWKNFTTPQNLILQYSTDGSAWVNIQNIPLTYPNVKEWTNFTVTLPSGARSATTRFRWATQSSSAAGNWAIDNIELRAPEPPRVPWVDYVQTSVLNSSTVHLSWPSPTPTGLSNQIDPDGVYMFQVERRVGSGFWETVGLVDGTFFPIFIDYAAPSNQTLFYRVRTLTAWDEALPSMTSTATTISQLNEWRLVNFGITENIGPYADTAVDEYGIANIQRYAFGFEAGELPRPYESGTGRAGIPTVWLDPITTRLNVSFMRRMPSTNPEIEYVVEFSEDLINWTPRPTPAHTFVVRGNWEEVRFEQPSVAYLTERCFVRVRIVRQ